MGGFRLSAQSALEKLDTVQGDFSGVACNSAEIVLGKARPTTVQAWHTTQDLQCELSDGECPDPEWSAQPGAADTPATCSVLACECDAVSS